jgi:hypothetical protein
MTKTLPGSLALAMFGILAVVGTSAYAAVDPVALCKEKKAKATGRKMFDLLKAFGKNVKTPNVGKLASEISKAQSKFTKGFTKAEAPGLCERTGDADAIETTVDGQIADVLAELLSGPPLGQHKCVLDSAQSQVLLDFGFTTLPVPAAGSIDIDCGGVNAGTGTAACSCTLQDFAPVQLGALGFLCVTPSASACNTGQIDCDGGSGLDLTVVQDHTIGTCTSQADCEAQCAVTCGADMPINAACEGFCLGGSNPGAVCTADSTCLSGGHCPGPNGGHVTAHHCQCGCLAMGGAPSAPGALKCELGVNIVFETSTPCDGTDVSISIGDTCVPLTTQTSAGVITSANLGAGTLPSGGPVVQTGTPADCATLANSVTTGIETVGFVGFHDTTLSDAATLIQFQCQCASGSLEPPGFATGFAGGLPGSDRWEGWKGRSVVAGEDRGITTGAMIGRHSRSR